MKRIAWSRSAFLLLIGVPAVLFLMNRSPRVVSAKPAAPALSGQSAAQFAVLLGVNDSEPTRWDGSIRAKGARITGLDGWRLGEGPAHVGSKAHADRILVGEVQPCRRLVDDGDAFGAVHVA